MNMKYKIIEKVSGNLFVVPLSQKPMKGDRVITGAMDAIQARKKQAEILISRQPARTIQVSY